MADSLGLKREQLIDLLNTIANAEKSGLTWPMAFQTIKDLLSPQLRDEIELTLNEFRLGCSANEALCGLANRTQIEPLHRAVRELIVGQSLGSSIEAGFNSIIHDLKMLPIGTTLERNPNLPDLTPPSTERPEPQIPPSRTLARVTGSDTDSPSAEWTNLKLQAHRWILEKTDVKKLALSDESHGKLVARQNLEVLLEEFPGSAGLNEAKARFLQEVISEAVGLGPLEELLADDAVEEILVHSAGHIAFNRTGTRLPSKVTFSSDLMLYLAVERILNSMGKRADEAHPFAEGVTPNGVLVTVVLPPLSLSGPVLLLRKSPRAWCEDPVGQKILSEAMAEFLRLCVRTGLSIIVASADEGCSSSVLSWLSDQIDKNQRAVLISESAEFGPALENRIALRPMPADLEGKGKITLSQLVQIASELSPDRVVLGTDRDAGAILRMFRNSGARGYSLLMKTSGSSPREALLGMEMRLSAPDMSLTPKAAREMIARGAALIVQCSRLTDGTCKVSQITEISGISGELISLSDLFIFRQHGLDKNRNILGQFMPTGIIPGFIETLESSGFVIPRHLFALEART